MNKDFKTIDYIKYAFISVAVLELVACAFEIDQLRHITKPLLMPILLVYLRKGTTGQITMSFLFAAGAIIFSFVGDALLMFMERGAMFFLAGLIAFALAHLSYVLSYSRAKDSEHKIPVLTKILYAIPFLIVLVGVLIWVLPGVEAMMKLPVVLYGVIINMTILVAIYRNGGAIQESVNQVTLGSIFFLMSDMLLALNLFVQPMANADVWVMLTYIFAQWNIINGLQKHYNA